MNLNNNSDFFSSNSNIFLFSQDIKNILKSPSPLGIEKDILSLLQKYSVSIEQYFSLIQQILSKKSSRSIEENYLISGYLILMKDFTNLMSKNSSETKQDLTLISNKLGYEKWNENMILMRMGEKGKKAYIMLNGNIDILIKTVNVFELNEYEYLYYLTNLIRFKEFGLLNFVVNDNFTVYPLVIVDDLEEMKKKSFKGKNEMEKNILDEIDEKEDDHNNNENNNENNENNNENNNNNNNENNENNNNNNENNDNNNNNEIIENKPNTKENQNAEKDQNESFFKLTPSNVFLSSSKKCQKFKASYLLQKFFPDISIFSKTYQNSLSQTNTQNYISRINIFSSFSSKSKKKSSSSEETLYSLKIYSYIKIISRTTGALFGEIALSDPQAIRTATIITTSVCHFGTLNKNNYVESIKSSADKQLKSIVNFLHSFEIFNEINPHIFYKKYFIYFSKKTVFKNFNITNENESCNEIIFIKEGNFNVFAKMNILDLSQLLINFYKKTKDNKKISFLENEILNDEYNMRLNFNYKNFYNKKKNILFFELNCPNIIGLNDYLINEKINIFTVKCKSSKGEIFILKKKFYNEMKNKDFTIKIGEKNYYQKQFDYLIKIFENIRANLIKSFFDFKNVNLGIDVKLKNEFEKIEDDFQKKKNQFDFNNQIINVKEIFSNKNYNKIINDNFGYEINKKNFIFNNNNNNENNNKIIVPKLPFHKINFSNSFLRAKNLSDISNFNTSKNKNLKNDFLKEFYHSKIKTNSTLLIDDNKIKQYSIYREKNYFSDDESYNNNNNSIYFKTNRINNNNINNSNIFKNTETKKNYFTSINNKKNYVFLNELIWENINKKKSICLTNNNNNNNYFNFNNNFNNTIENNSFSKKKIFLNKNNNNSYSMNKTCTMNAFSPNNQNKKKNIIINSINVIRNNLNNNVLDIKDYVDIKKEKYIKNRNKNLNKNLKRFKLFFGMNNNNNNN